MIEQFFIYRYENFFEKKLQKILQIKKIVVSLYQQRD